MSPSTLNLPFRSRARASRVSPAKPERWHRLDVHVDPVLARTQITVLGVLDIGAVAEIQRAVRTARAGEHSVTLELGDISSITPHVLADALPRRPSRAIRERADAAPAPVWGRW